MGAIYKRIGCVYLSKIVTLYIITTYQFDVNWLNELCISFKNCNFVHHNNAVETISPVIVVVYIFQKL